MGYAVELLRERAGTSDPKTWYDPSMPMGTGHWELQRPEVHLCEGERRFRGVRNLWLRGQAVVQTAANGSFEALSTFMWLPYARRTSRRLLHCAADLADDPWEFPKAA